MPRLSYHTTRITGITLLALIRSDILVELINSRFLRLLFSFSRRMRVLAKGEGPGHLGPSFARTC